jgi:hypothetical protein
MIDLTCCLIESKFCFLDPEVVDGFESTPSDNAKPFMTSSGTTPAISCMSRGAIGAGGSVEVASLDADWRYVIDRRRSPAEVETRAEMTSSVTCTRSESAICASLAEVEPVSRGLNLNLEQRDAKGSIILRGARQPEVVKQWSGP